jgi:thioredoxin-disulfide reductase
MEENLNNSIYDLVIIGGASAGLTAGIYAGRKKMKTVLLSKQIGGQSLITSTIENFPGFKSISGKELTSKIREQVENYGVEIQEGEEVESINKNGSNFNIETKAGESIEAKTIVLATGKNPRRLGVPGEKEFEGRGVSFCTICDAPLFSGKDVVVVGGGSSGLESALDLSKYANKIYLLDHGPKIKGEEALGEKIKALGDKVEYIVSADVQEIKGNTMVEKIVYKNNQSGEIKELNTSGVFVNVGWIPATKFLGDFVETNEIGEVVVNHRTNTTSVPGVFAAGDLTDNKYKQCVIAAGEGAKATLSAYDYILGRK